MRAGRGAGAPASDRLQLPHPAGGLTNPGRQYENDPSRACIGRRGDDDPTRKIKENSNPAQGEQGPDQADERRVQFEVFGYPGCYAPSMRSCER